MDQALANSLVDKAEEFANSMQHATRGEIVDTLFNMLVEVNNNAILRTKPIAQHLNNLNGLLSRTSQSDVDWQKAREIHKNMVSQVEGIKMGIIDPNMVVARDEAQILDLKSDQGTISNVDNIDWDKIQTVDDIKELLKAVGMQITTEDPDHPLQKFRK